MLKGLATKISRKPNTELGAYLRRQQRGKDTHDNQPARQGRKHQGKVFTLWDRDIVICSVKSGKPRYIKKKVRVVIIRQEPDEEAQRHARRFEDNAA